jgi:hypothetical protein
LLQANRVAAAARAIYKKFKANATSSSSSSSADGGTYVMSTLPLQDILALYKSLGFSNAQFYIISKSKNDAPLEQKYRGELLAGLYQLGLELERLPQSSAEYTYQERQKEFKRIEQDMKDEKAEIGRRALMNSELGKKGKFKDAIRGHG